MNAEEQAKADARDIEEIEKVVRRVAQRAMGRVYNRAHGVEWTATVTLGGVRCLLFERQTRDEFEANGPRIDEGIWDRAIKKACAAVTAGPVKAANDVEPPRGP